MVMFFVELCWLALGIQIRPFCCWYFTESPVHHKDCLKTYPTLRNRNSSKDWEPNSPKLVDYHLMRMFFNLGPVWTSTNGWRWDLCFIPLMNCCNKPYISKKAYKVFLSLQVELQRGHLQVFFLTNMEYGHTRKSTSFLKSCKMLGG